MLFVGKNTQFPAILVQITKHGDNYYLVNNVEDISNVCWKLFSENFSIGYYNDGIKNPELDLLNQAHSLKFPWKYLPTVKDTYSFYIETVKSLESGVIPDLLKDNFINYPEHAEKMSTVKYWKSKAYKIIQERSEYEYENVVLESFCKY